MNVALPVLRQRLDASVAQAQWGVEAYILFLASLLLVGGSLGDRFGRRRVFAGSVVLVAATMSSVDESRAGLALGISNAVSRLAMLLAIALAAVVIGGSIETGLAQIGWFLAMLAVAGAVSAGLLVDSVEKTVSPLGSCWTAVLFFAAPLDNLNDSRHDGGNPLL